MTCETRQRWTLEACALFWERMLTCYRPDVPMHEHWTQCVALTNPEA